MLDLQTKIFKHWTSHGLVSKTSDTSKRLRNHVEIRRLKLILFRRLLGMKTSMIRRIHVLIRRLSDVIPRRLFRLQIQRLLGYTTTACWGGISSLCMTEGGVFLFISWLSITTPLICLFCRIAIA